MTTNFNHQLSTCTCTHEQITNANIDGCEKLVLWGITIYLSKTILSSSKNGTLRLYI